jgi:hypothetical protein
MSAIFHVCYHIMPKYKDITGQVFGKFTVISLHGATGKNNASTWNVRCECGNESIKSNGALWAAKKNGSSCRKCRKYVGGVSAGDKFGELTVIEEYEHNRYGIVWTVKCSCGNLSHRTASSLNYARKRMQMCLSCAHIRSGQIMLSRSREHVLNNARSRSSVDRLELDPFLDHTMASYDQFKSDLMDELEQVICPRRTWLYEHEIPGMNADFDNETSHFPEYEDLKMDRSKCNIEAEEVDEVDEEEQVYKVLTDGSIETNDVQEAIKLSKLIRNSGNHGVIDKHDRPGLPAKWSYLSPLSD